MKPKHTPGPWSHRGGTVSAADTHICTMQGESPALTAAQVAANARLIAESPAMLAVLEDVRIHLYTQLCLVHDDITAALHDRAYSLIHKVKAGA